MLFWTNFVDDVQRLSTLILTSSAKQRARRRRSLKMNLRWTSTLVSIKTYWQLLRYLLTGSLTDILPLHCHIIAARISLILSTTPNLYPLLISHMSCTNTCASPLNIILSSLQVAMHVWVWIGWGEQAFGGCGGFSWNQSGSTSPPIQRFSIQAGFLKTRNLYRDLSLDRFTSTFNTSP